MADQYDDLLREVKGATNGVAEIIDMLVSLEDNFEAIKTRQLLSFPNDQAMKGMAHLTETWRKELAEMRESLMKTEESAKPFRQMAYEEYPEDVILSEGYEHHPVRLFSVVEVER